MIGETVVARGAEIKKVEKLMPVLHIWMLIQCIISLGISVPESKFFLQSVMRHMVLSLQGPKLSNHGVDLGL